ncbi:MAG TPA: PilZ domain-containing protein, partial [Thermoanaerobaculia bacterium]|nr:PilZ domain-containing protein [Thermoanaerobaculia bacterium]
MTDSDRRGFQRLRLSKPILALMNEQNALILDVGVSGAYVEHYGEVQPGQRFRLSFRWHGEDIEYSAEVARSRVIRTPGGDGQSLVSHTGFRFLEPMGDSASRLQDMMATFVGRVLAAQKANAAAADADGEGASILAQLGEARRVRSRGYVAYHFHGGKWSREATNEARQPQDGFTVAAHEDEEELETL